MLLKSGHAYTHFRPKINPEKVGALFSSADPFFRCGSAGVPWQGVMFPVRTRDYFHTVDIVDHFSGDVREMQQIFFGNAVEKLHPPVFENFPQPVMHLLTLGGNAYFAVTAVFAAVFFLCTSPLRLSMAKVRERLFLSCPVCLASSV